MNLLVHEPRGRSEGHKVAQKHGPRAQGGLIRAKRGLPRLLLALGKKHRKSRYCGPAPIQEAPISLSPWRQRAVDSSRGI